MTSNYLILTERNTVTAVDPESGATIWQTDLGASFLDSHMVVGEGVVVIATSESLHCCRYDVGTLLWSVPIPDAALTLGLVVEGGRVYVLTFKALLAFDGHGRKLFHRPCLHFGGSMGFQNNVCWSPHPR